MDARARTNGGMHVVLQHPQAAAFALHRGRRQQVSGRKCTFGCCTLLTRSTTANEDLKVRRLFAEEKITQLCLALQKRLLDRRIQKWRRCERAPVHALLLLCVCLREYRQ